RRGATNSAPKFRQLPSVAPVETLRLFTDYAHSSLFLDSQISTRARLISITHRDDIPAIPAQQRASTGDACWRSGERRLRVRSTQPDLRGSRETLPGPTTWVRPATGWWGRMNAGETPRNQGRSVWPPLSVSRRRSRDLRKP